MNEIEYEKYFFVDDNDGLCCFNKNNLNVKNLIIPEQIGGKKVTEIQNFSFQCCESFAETITLPSTIKCVHPLSFLNMSKLKNVNYQNGFNVHFCPNTFYNCPSLKRLPLPNGMINIPNRFATQCGFENLEIPNGITDIEKQALKDNWMLKSVRLPNSVKAIKAEAFKNCFRMESINISQNCDIEEGAFENCEKLQILYDGSFIENLHNINRCNNNFNKLIFYKDFKEELLKVENDFDIYAILKPFNESFLDMFNKQLSKDTNLITDINKKLKYINVQSIIENYKNKSDIISKDLER